MIFDLKPYPAYKDSGVPWLHSIPASWSILRAKNVFRVIADVVTGKLDVREAAANLPDEIEELAPLEDVDALVENVVEEGASEPEFDEVAG
jgi:hypothetical protein